MLSALREPPSIDDDPSDSSHTRGGPDAPHARVPGLCRTARRSPHHGGGRLPSSGPEREEIGGVVAYDEKNDGLVYDILVIPDDQNPTAGRYLFRFVDSHPQHVPSFELRSDDVDAVLEAMRQRNLLPAA